MTETSIRRYTNLPGALHVLQNSTLTLLSPSSWDDRNDAYFMEAFQMRSSAKSVLALCFAEASETYHHWRVFSSGSDGVCMEFDTAKLQEAATSHSRFKCRSVVYRTIKVATSKGIQTEELPFVKRYPFRDEREFRIISVHRNEVKEFDQLSISLSAIKRITLSPWMPEQLLKAVRTTLTGIKGCTNLRVHKSTLVENKRWKRIANPDLK